MDHNFIEDAMVEEVGKKHTISEVPMDEDDGSDDEVPGLEPITPIRSTVETPRVIRAPTPEDDSDSEKLDYGDPD